MESARRNICHSNRKRNSPAQPAHMIQLPKIAQVSSLQNNACGED
jgi:hypothetical protein